MKLDVSASPRILIVRLSALGDVIFALPVATAVRRHWPEAEIVWLVESASADLVRQHPDVDQVIEVERKGIRRAWRRPWRVPGAVARVWRSIRTGRAGRRFDLVLDLHGNGKSGIMTGIAGGRVRVGHGRGSRKENLNALFSNKKVLPLLPEGSGKPHRSERDLGFLRALGIPAQHEVRPLRIPQEHKVAADEFLQSLGGAGPVVAIHPGTSQFGAFKRWAPERFAQLGDQLVRDTGARIVISWGPDERALAEEVRGTMNERATLLPPPKGLLFLAAIYRKATLVVGADSGPLHLASLMGAPTLTLFGPKDPEIYKPGGANSEVVYKAVECSPCTLRYCDHVTCMVSMQVEDVAEPARRILAAQDRSDLGSA